MSWEWVLNDAELAAAMRCARRSAAVAVDTEFRRQDTFFPQVALVQVATEERCWLIDPLQLTDPQPLRDLLLDPDTIKVLHSASEDLEVFEYWLGVRPAPLFDCQRAAALLNYGFGVSYSALVKRLLDVDVAKDETRSNWLSRPLSPAQCEYAALDVTLLIQCWPSLAQQCHDRQRYDWVLEEGSLMTTGGRGPHAKFTAAWKMTPQQQRVLLALIDWREQQARVRDKPRSWILPDRALNEIAKIQPIALPQLAAVEGISKGLLRREGKRLLDVIADAMAGQTSPASGIFPQPPNAQVRRCAKVLAAGLHDLAVQLDVNVEILLPARELESIAREAAGEEVAIPRHWLGWRRERVIDPTRERAREFLRREAGQ